MRLGRVKTDDEYTQYYEVSYEHTSKQLQPSQGA